MSNRFWRVSLIALCLTFAAIGIFNAGRFVGKTDYICTGFQVENPENAK